MPTDEERAEQIEAALAGARQEQEQAAGALSEQFQQLVSSLDEIAGRMSAMADASDRATSRVNEGIGRSVESFREAAQTVRAEFERSIVGPLTAGADQVTQSLGPVGTAIQGIGRLLDRIPGVGWIVGLVAGFTALQVSATIVEKDMQARTARIGAILEGYGDLGWKTAEDIQGALHHIGTTWEMGLQGAEQFVSKIAAIGPLHLWREEDDPTTRINEMEQALKDFADSIMHLSLDAAVSEDVTLKYFQRLFQATSMQRDMSDELVKSLQAVFTYGERSGMGVQSFTDAVMRGAEQMQLFGAEQRTVVETSRFLDVMMHTLREDIPGGVAGVIEVFESAMGIAGRLMQDIPKMLFIHDKPGMRPFEEMEQIFEGLRKEEDGRVGIDPVELLTRYYDVMWEHLGQDRGRMGLYLVEQYKMMVPQAAEFMRLMQDIDEAREAGDLAALGRHEEDMEKLVEEMTPPLDRIKVLIESMVVQLLPAIAQLMSSLLTGILIAIPMGIATLKSFIAEIPVLGVGHERFAEPAQQLQEVFGRFLEDFGVQLSATGEILGEAGEGIAEILGGEGILEALRFGKEHQARIGEVGEILKELINLPALPAPGEQLDEEARKRIPGMEKVFPLIGPEARRAVPGPEYAAVAVGPRRALPGPEYGGIGPRKTIEPDGSINFNVAIRITPADIRQAYMQGVGA